MENKTNPKNIDIANAFKKKDVKKIRSIIAKYKNKTMDATTSLLHKSKSNDDSRGFIFTSNSFVVQNENVMNVATSIIPNEERLMTNTKNYNSNFNSQLGIDFRISTMNDMTHEIKKISTNNEEFFVSGIKSEFQTEDRMIANVRAGTSEENIRKLNEYRSNLEEKLNGIKAKLNKDNIKMDLQKLASIPFRGLITVLSFFDTVDLFQLIKINRQLRQKILNIFTDYGLKISAQFDHVYARQLKLDTKTITLHKYKRNKRGHLKISLIIKAKIISDKLRDKTVSIGYKAKFPIDKDKLKNVFKFDVKAPGPLSFWVMREYTYFHQDDLNKAYFQHIMQFCINDYIEITLNLFTEKGLFQYEFFKWTQLNLESIPGFNFLEFTNEHNKNREVLDFDLSRFCELEIVKNKWSELIHLENSDKIVNRIKSFFEPNLLVQKILFDDVGYHLFKVFLIACEKGKIKTDFELGISIEVIEHKQPLSNEVKKNCLIFDRKNEIQVRVGDIVVFYISKNK